MAGGPLAVSGAMCPLSSVGCWSGCFPGVPGAGGEGSSPSSAWASALCSCPTRLWAWARSLCSSLSQLLRLAAWERQVSWEKDHQGQQATRVSAGSKCHVRCCGDLVGSPRKLREALEGYGRAGVGAGPACPGLGYGDKVGEQGVQWQVVAHSLWGQDDFQELTPGHDLGLSGFGPCPLGLALGEGGLWAVGGWVCECPEAVGWGEHVSSCWEVGWSHVRGHGSLCMWPGQPLQELYLGVAKALPWAQCVPSGLALGPLLQRASLPPLW